MIVYGSGIATKGNILLHHFFIHPFEDNTVKSRLYKPCAYFHPLALLIGS